MKVRRAGSIAAVWVMAGVSVVGAQAPGGGEYAAESRGRATATTADTVRPIAIDPGRPWGWAVRDFMDDPNQPLYNTTKQKMLEGRQVYSHIVNRFDIEAYCRDAQIYDFSRFEMQHSTITFADIEAMIAACPRSPATPIVRVRSATEENIQQAVDIGALGIIIPTVDDADQARAAARYARFPPTARRSTGGGQTSGIWSPLVPAGRTFRQTINDNMLVIVMIETLEGVENALEIASVPGVDVVIIGSADMASFSGFEQGDLGYMNLLTRVRNATYRAGKYWGNANAGFSRNNHVAADSRFHLGGPPR